MRLISLEIYGFKSFSKKTKLVFPKNVTGIVGPNGSGKSNISDAVRWVLGEQSAKLLRGSKMEDVIFNGTQERNPLNFCEVSLIFDNADHTLPLDYSEVMITRRVFRSGESEYEINGKSCRLKDIVHTFSDTGIGKEGYSIIGQGRIDEILSNNADKRRAVFEEAAGIMRYRMRKYEAELRLNRTNENLQRIDDIIIEQENLLGPLQIQSENAKKYLELNERLKKLSASLFVINYDRLNSQKKATSENIEQISDEIKFLDDAINKLEEERLDLSSKSSQIETLCSSAAEAVILSDRAVGNMEAEISNSETKCENENENLKRYNEEINQCREDIVALNKAIADGDTGKQEAEEQLNSVKNKLEIITKDYDIQNSNAENLESELNEAKVKLVEAVNALSDTQSNKARQTAIKEQMQKQYENFCAQQKKQLLVNDELKTNIDDIKQNFDVEKQRFDELRSEFDISTKKLAVKSSLVQSKSKELQNIVSNLNEMKAKYRALNSMIEDFEGYGYSVKTALKEAKQQNIKGVHGVVARVIEVPKRFENAIDIVLGGALQSIITESEFEAKQLIEILRNKQAGRATFLPLNTVTGRYLNSFEKQVLAMPGCVGIASECLKFNEKYRPIVENLLGRTIIAETLQYGIEIKRKGGQQLRVVTLQGDVLHGGGSISGGSIRQKTNGLLSQQRILKELVLNINKYQEESINLNNEIESIKEQLETIKINNDEISNESHSSEMKLMLFKERLDQAKSDLHEKDDSDIELAETIAQLSQSIADIDIELNRIEKTNGDSLIDKDEIHKTIAQLTQKLHQARNERDELSKQLTSCRLDFSDKEHLLNQITHDSNRINKELENLIKREKSLTIKMEQSKEAVKELSNRIANLKQELLLVKEKSLQAAEAQKKAEKMRSENSISIRALQEEENNTRLAQMKAQEKTHKLELNYQNIINEQKREADDLWNRFELSYEEASEYQTDDDFKPRESKIEADSIRSQIKELGTVNVCAIDEYTELKERNDELSKQRTDLQKASDDLHKLIHDLLGSMEKQFVSQFHLLQGYFRTTFERLFGGGKGEIRLDDESNPLSCGIDIMVQPPGKKKQLLSLFSGGERALTAIALLFAMLTLKPSPFCFLDEIEAALDDANINYFADYLREFSKDTQFIVVTHRKGTMQHCDSLYGVTMVEKGVSSLMSVDLTKYEE